MEFNKVSLFGSPTDCKLNYMVIIHCRKVRHSTAGYSSYNRVWPWNWYSHWLLLCEEQERYIVYPYNCLSA